MGVFGDLKTEPRLAAVGVLTMARLVHAAEDLEDDVLSLQIMAEMDTRPREGEMFRQAYIDFHAPDQRARNVEAYRKFMAAP